MLNAVIRLFGAYFDGGIFNYVLRYIVALAFVATVPIIIRSFFKE